MNHYAKLISAVCLTMLLTTTGLRAGQIHDAVKAGDLDKVRELIEADPRLLESPDQWGRTPLYIACLKMKVAIMNFLIDKGANVNATNVDGVPVLYPAIQNRDESIGLVQLLIDNGAEVNINITSILSPLHRAANVGNIEVAKLLIDHGADLNFRCRHGTPLQSNIMNQESHEEMAIFFVENGAKAQEYSFGNNDLHLAAIQGYADLAQAMIKHGADVNTKNDYGHTPLYYAARHGHRRAADVLITAGADKSAILETNYGKAPQLSETLKEGEAYLWYLGGTAPGTGYAVKTKNRLLIFDPFKIDESLESGLANGKLNPKELAGQKITILLTRKELGPFGLTVSELAKQLPGADFILSFKPTADNDSGGDIPAYRLAKANESFSVGGMQIHTIQTPPSTVRSIGNLGYLVDVDRVKILHAGLHRSNNNASQIEEYRREIDFLKSFGPVDFAILPVGFHHLGFIDYEQYLYLTDQLGPKAIYLIGDDLVYEEHRKCLEVLKARNVPVKYPEGGIAMGERFHYLRD